MAASSHWLQLVRRALCESRLQAKARKLAFSKSALEHLPLAFATARRDDDNDDELEKV
jgi:hypothetical protein